MVNKLRLGVKIRRILCGILFCTLVYVVGLFDRTPSLFYLKEYPNEFRLRDYDDKPSLITAIKSFAPIGASKNKVIHALGQATCSSKKTPADQVVFLNGKAPSLQWNSKNYVIEFEPHIGYRSKVKGVQQVLLLFQGGTEKLIAFEVNITAPKKLPYSLISKFYEPRWIPLKKPCGFSICPDWRRWGRVAPLNKILWSLPVPHIKN